MTAAEKIAAASALIEPLTGHTPGPWMVNDHARPADPAARASVEIDTAHEFVADFWNGKGQRQLANARLAAAAPALRDTVAALADLADALAQENDKLTAENERLRDALKPFAQAADGRRRKDAWGSVCFGQSVLLNARAALGDTP